MNLYQIFPKEPISGWDIYRAAIVAATTEERACHIHPDGFWLEDDKEMHQDWYLPCDVKAMLIGQTERYKEGDVILSDYRAG